MQGICLLQVIFILTFLISSEVQDVIGSGHSCLRLRPADDGQTSVTFLRGDTAGVRSLYLSLWSEDMRLVTCELNTDPRVTERYRAICDRIDSRGQEEEVIQRFNISALLAPEAPCALVSSSAPRFTRRRDGTEGRARRKRAWLFPGTLWCGTGSKAIGYEQLGMFESVDRCCREHDHCLHIIPSFTVNYGVFNPKFFTVSHCDCDQRFRQCLLGVNDTISSMVGYSFFNILRVPCFELKQQKRCTEMYWWGMCKVAKEAPYAIFKSPLLYNTSDVARKYGDNADSNNLTSSEGKHVTKSKQRCNSREPPRGDTFYRRRTMGKGCKRHQKFNTVAPSQMPPISRAPTTIVSMKKALINASNSKALMSNKKRTGKEKSTKKGLLAYLTQQSQFPPQVTANSYPQTTSATTSAPSLTLKPALQLHLPRAITEATKTHKKVSKLSRCCGLGIPLKGDTSQPHCKSCLEQKTKSHKATVTPSTTTYGLQIEVSTLETLQPKKTTETPKEDTLKTLQSTASSATLVTTKLKTAASIHKDDKPLKQVDSHLLWNYKSQEPMGATQAQNTETKRGLKQNIALHNMTDNQRLCRSLKHLDDCKYKIPPLEKKYDLQNMESKTAYNCHCTSRLAVQIEIFKQPSTLPRLLMDFVSQYCFKLPKQKKCHSRKSCSGGFTKASDLLRALKKMEERDAALVRNSSDDRKRGIPVRLYKRCLRLEREYDIMAQLT